MISFLIIYFFSRHDSKLCMEINENDGVILAFIEMFIFLINMFYLSGIFGGNVNFGCAFVCILFISVYKTVTTYIDYATGYIYIMLNYISMLVLLSVIIINNKFLDIFLESLVFICFLIFLEKINSYSGGDTGYLIVSYLFINIFTDGINSIIYILFVMLSGAMVFAVFRKLGNRKGMISYTPFLLFSEFIINIILCIKCI